MNYIKILLLVGSVITAIIEALKKNENEPNNK